MKDEAYRAGSCNIGKSEIKRRENLFRIFLIHAIAFSLLYFFQRTYSIALFIFILSAASFLVMMQIKYRFCIVFGITGHYNFDDYGKKETVRDSQSLKKDRMKSLRIIVLSILFGIIYTGILSWVFSLF